MIVFLNGAFIPEEQAVVSIFDRSFRYGDGLFEAVLVRHGKMFRGPEHLRRMDASAKFFRMAFPYSCAQFLAFAQELIAANGVKDAVLRIQLSRGVGPRGYALTGKEKPLVSMSLHPAPARESISATRWKLIASSLRIAPDDPLSHHKTCCRLVQVLAAAEARERDGDEALLLNTNGEITEGSTSNVFWIREGTVCTSPLAAGLLPGVTRGAIFGLCDALGLPRAEEAVWREELFASEGVFLSLTTRGIVEAESLDGRPLRCSAITTRLQQEFESLLEKECA